MFNAGVTSAAQSGLLVGYYRRYLVASMAGKFALERQGGQVPFSVEGGQRRGIAVSEAYESKSSAKNGIESVRKNAADATVDDQT